MISKTERGYFRIAKTVSELSDHPQQLGCVVVNKHQIISSGSNSSTRCHPIQAKLDKERYGIECLGKCHAESSALIPLIKKGLDLSGAKVYVYRQHGDGTLAMSRPCPSCMRLIKACGIKHIAYTTDDGFAIECLQI